MGSRSSSASKTLTNYDARDEKMAADNGAYAVRDSSVVVNQTADSAVDLGGAYAQAASDMTERGFKTAADLASMSGDVAGGAIDQMRRNSLDTMDLSGRAIASVQGAGRDALKFAGASLDDALDHAAGDRDAAYKFAGSAMTMATRGLDAVNGAMAATLNASRTESTQISSQFLRLGIPALALVLIAGSFAKK